MYGGSELGRPVPVAVSVERHTGDDDEAEQGPESRLQACMPGWRLVVEVVHRHI